MNLNPYLTFNGQCESALKFYERCHLHAYWCSSGWHSWIGFFLPPSKPNRSSTSSGRIRLTCFPGGLGSAVASDASGVVTGPYYRKRLLKVSFLPGGSWKCQPHGALRAEHGCSYLVSRHDIISR